MPYKVILADDHRVMRQGLRGLLEKINDLEVVAEADNGAQALKLAIEHNPDLVVMDVAMPELNGLEATKRILRECRHTKVLALSMQTNRQLVLGMLKAGAAAYLLKDCSFEELNEAIAQVLRGGAFLSPKVADIVVGQMHGDAQKQQAPAAAKLTGREREILQLIAEAQKSKEIAAKLNISLKTVYTHRRNIMEKLAAKNLAELTRFAIREGITSLDY